MSDCHECLRHFLTIASNRWVLTHFNIQLKACTLPCNCTIKLKFCPILSNSARIWSLAGPFCLLCPIDQICKMQCLLLVITRKNFTISFGYSPKFLLDIRVCLFIWMIRRTSKLHQIGKLCATLVSRIQFRRLYITSLAWFWASKSKRFVSS